METPEATTLFPKDAIARAKAILASFKGGVGAYQDSRGNMMVREEVADFIKARDGDVKTDGDVSGRPTAFTTLLLIHDNRDLDLCYTICFRDSIPSAVLSLRDGVVSNRSD
jgi:hypothetical protein